MKVTTSNEAFDMPDDAPVFAFKGTVKTVLKYNTGENEHGKWSFQSLVLVDPSGVEINAKLKDRDTFPANLKGKLVYFLSHQGDKGWSGVKTKDDTFKGNTTRILWITPTAEVVEAAQYESGGNSRQEAHGGAGAAAASSSRQAAAEPHAGQQRTQQQQSGASRQNADKGVNDAKRFVGRNESFVKIALTRYLSVQREFGAKIGIPANYVFGDHFGTAVLNALMFGGSSAGITDQLPAAIDFETLKPIVKEASQQPKPEPPKCPKHGIVLIEGKCSTCIDEANQPPEDDDVPF